LSIDFDKNLSKIRKKQYQRGSLVMEYLNRQSVGYEYGTGGIKKITLSS
jgi:hypothetical protein